MPIRIMNSAGVNDKNSVGIFSENAIINSIFIE